MCEGRVGLHALPQAEEFYRKCGMTPIFRDPQHEDLVYYEFTKNQAQLFLSNDFIASP